MSFPTTARPVLPSSLALSLALTACAGTKGGERDQFIKPPDTMPAVAPQSDADKARAEAPRAEPAAPPAGPFDPKAYAANFDLPSDCEMAARKLQARSADTGWSLMRACIEKRNFTAIRLLTAGPWDKDLQTRPEAASLIAKIVAQRGGDVEGDLGLLRQRKIPVFTLGAAMAQPDTYKGRLLVLRARVSEIRAQGGKATVKLAETSVGGVTSEVETGPAVKSTYSSQGRGSVDVKTSRYGNASAKGEYSSSSDYRSTTTELRHDNQTTETGREALGRLAKPDPFLEPDKDFIFLVRFDGARTSSSNEDEGEKSKVGVLSIISYQEPSALMFE